MGADHCDCERIVNTVEEVPTLLSSRDCATLIAAADRRAAEVGWQATQHVNYPTDDVKVSTLEDPAALDVFCTHVEEPLQAQVERLFGLPAGEVVTFDSFIVRYTVRG